MKIPKNAPLDSWNWGTETILWGFDSSHEFTFKMLEPKLGREGCLSLQYHHKKSECWYCLRGVAWALVVIDQTPCTRIMHAGDLQLLPVGTIHRLMACTNDLRILEPSTPDAHAADKSLPKDVVRLHCVFGRECAAPRDSKEKNIVERSIELTEQAISSLERGELPKEHNVDYLQDYGAWAIK